MPGSVLVVLHLHLLEYSHPVFDIGLTISHVLGMSSEAGKAHRLAQGHPLTVAGPPRGRIPY